MNSQEKEELIHQIKQEPASKIEHIKFVRQQQGLGLKEAKELVDGLYSEISKSDPTFKDLTKNKGCFSIIAIGFFVYATNQLIESWPL